MKRMANWSLRTQFIMGIVLVLVFSMLATIVTYAAGVFLFVATENKGVFPSNHYEKQIPAIRNYISGENIRLLDPDARLEFEEKVPPSGFLYQVTDTYGRVLYGTLNDRIFSDKNELLNAFNTVKGYEGRYVHTIPIVDAEDRITGSVLLSYALSPSYAADRSWLAILFGIVLVSPFFYILLFTFLFAKRLAQRINQPIQMLMRASQKIAEQDLNFTITYQAENELGRLCEAFTRMQQELQASLSAQWRLEQEKIEMTEALAHDLKTPMTVIIGYADALLGAEEQDGKRRKYLMTIRDNAKKSARMLRQLQFSSELEQSGEQLQAEQVEVVPWAEQLLKQFEQTAVEKGIQISYQTTAAAERSYRIDRGKVERILENLLGNAIAYTPEGGSVRLQLIIEETQLAFAVHDNGPGFRNGDEQKAFERFYRADKARGQADGHAGLGLYIAKKLTHAHGGTIRAENNPDGGAVVSFTIRLL